MKALIAAAVAVLFVAGCSSDTSYRHKHSSTYMSYSAQGHTGDGTGTWTTNRSYGVEYWHKR